MEDFLKELGTSLTKVDWFVQSGAVIVILFVVILAFFLIRRTAKGDEFSFLGMSIKKDAIAERLQSNFDELNEDSKQKTAVIKLLNQVNEEISRVNVHTTYYEDFLHRKSLIYRYILHSIGSVMTKQKSNTHRVAVFIDNKDGYLKIHEGSGYSPAGLENLRLDIRTTVAGHTYTSGEKFKSGDIYAEGSMFKPHPNATKIYHSLMCVPIKCDSMTLGVLSIDGHEKDSFTKDDEDYLTYFANALISLMFMEKLNEQPEEGINDEEIIDLQQQRQAT